MSDDARFEDGGDKPLRLMAVDAGDLEVISTLVQDAVFLASEMSWSAKRREFALLLNRFRWEDRETAQSRGRAVERVQSVLIFGDVVKVQSQGVERGDPDLVLSLLSVSWEPGEDGTGRALLTLAGDGVIALEMETIDAKLQDVTRPYAAPSKKSPGHPE